MNPLAARESARVPLRQGTAAPLAAALPSSTPAPADEAQAAASFRRGTVPLTTASLQCELAAHEAVFACLDGAFDAEAELDPVSKQELSGAFDNAMLDPATRSNDTVLIDRARLNPATRVLMNRLRAADAFSDRCDVLKDALQALHEVLELEKYLAAQRLCLDQSLAGDLPPGAAALSSALPAHASNTVGYDLLMTGSQDLRNRVTALESRLAALKSGLASRVSAPWKDDGREVAQFQLDALDQRAARLVRDDKVVRGVVLDACKRFPGGRAALALFLRPGAQPPAEPALARAVATVANCHDRRRQFAREYAVIQRLTDELKLQNTHHLMKHDHLAVVHARVAHREATELQIRREQDEAVRIILGEREDEFTRDELVAGQRDVDDAAGQFEQAAQRVESLLFTTPGRAPR